MSFGAYNPNNNGWSPASYVSGPGFQQSIVNSANYTVNAPDPSYIITNSGPGNNNQYGNLANYTPQPMWQVPPPPRYGFPGPFLGPRNINGQYGMTGDQSSNNMTNVNSFNRYYNIVNVNYGALSGFLGLMTGLLSNQNDALAQGLLTTSDASATGSASSGTSSGTADTTGLFPNFLYGSNSGSPNTYGYYPNQSYGNAASGYDAFGSGPGYSDPAFDF